MYKFTDLYIEGYTVFSEPIHISLDNQGVIWAIGINKDSKKGSNGSGKSTLVNTIATVLFELLTDDHMSDKNNCLLSLKWTFNKSTYHVYQFRKLDKKRKEKLIQEFKDNGYKNINEDFKPSGYKIFINNKDVTKHGIPDCRKQIKTIFALTEDEFYGYVCTSPNVANTLIDGSTTERRKYFEKVFSVLQSYKMLYDKLDSRFKSIQEKYEELKEYKLLLTEIDSQLLELKDKKTLEGLIENLQSKITEIEKEKTEVDDKVKSIEQKLYNNKKRKEIEEQLNEIEEVSEKEFNRAEKELKEIKTKERNLTEKLTLAKQQAKQYDELSNAKKEIDKKEIDLDKDYDNTIEEGSEKLSSVSAKAKDKRQFLNDLKKLHSPDCPTCKRPLDHKEIKSHIKKLEDEISTLEESQEKIKTKLSKIKEEAKLVKSYNSLYKSYHAQKLVPEKVSFLEEQLSAFTKTEKELKAKVRAFEKRQEVEKLLKKYPKEELPPKKFYEKLKDRSGIINTELKTFVKECSEYEAHLSQLNKLHNKKEKYTEALKDFSKVEKKLNLYKALRDAYGDKGLKVKQIVNLCKKLVDRLPGYTNSMFQEKNIRFTHNLKKDSFDIIMHRHFSDSRKKSIDIRRLSSGERKRFIPALMLAQNDLAPVHKKTNLFIADELDANLDPLAKESFANNFIPILKKKFPTVIVIAHSPEMYSQNYDKKWIITKTKGKSTLKVENIHGGN